ncbi:MAG: hypothetical protein WDN67_00555 [Candidatus Moraniibacteriota bacterium]
MSKKMSWDIFERDGCDYACVCGFELKLPPQAKEIQADPYPETLVEKLNGNLPLTEDSQDDLYLGSLAYQQLHPEASRTSPPEA